MCATRIHTQIIQYPFAPLMQGARLDSYQEKDGQIILEVQGFQTASSKLFERGGKILEQVKGKHVPLKLAFFNVSKIKRDDFFVSLEKYPQGDPSRIIAYMLSWRQPKKRDVFSMFGLRGPVGADMQFFAQHVKFEIRGGRRKSFTVERDWSPAPSMPERLVPEPKSLHRRFGGDPITIKMKDQTHHRRLFIGGLDVQPKHRPQVDAVLNLGENPSRWVRGKDLHPNDRAVERGEGSLGMTMAEMKEEANWVIERLKQNKRVLAHCVAGMNRSTTICCAVLILLEGLSAEEAIARVREHHPWARPDSYHWLTLRWLAKTNRK